MNRDVFVYISGPITAKAGRSIEQNVADAVAVYLDLLRAGIPCFCPHLSAAFPTAHTAVGYEAWMSYDFAVIDRCTHVLALERHALSAGALREVEYAMTRGLPIFYSTEALIAAHGAVTV